MLLDLVLITVVTWLTYGYCVKNSGFVSDDLEGLVSWDGKVKKFNYGYINKWILLKLLGKSSQANHFFSILVHNANAILLYSLLATLADKTVALYATLLFAVHPIGTQAVAWISGRGYPIGLSFALLLLNIQTLYAPTTLNFGNPSEVAAFAVVLLILTLLYYLAVNAQFATLATFVILAFLGHWFSGFLGLGVSLFCGIGIIREVIGLRKSTFKEQNLEKSTYIKPVKIVVALKSLAYYTYLCLFPQRLGLYHTFFYHYNEKTEKDDKWSWLGLGLVLAMVAGLIYAPFIVKLGILWYVTYLFIFLNWITIHQFVSERYAYIANIGLCIILVYYLRNQQVLFTILCTMYMVRTWINLPAYKDEVTFYQSNIWNFPDSEVAFANLGVVYMRCGLIGAAIDMWQISAKINPDYDVAHYNIHSVMKQKGDLVNARKHLELALKAKVCHFKDVWTAELNRLDEEMSFMKELNEVYQKITDLEKDPSKKVEASELRKKLDSMNNLKKTIDENRQKNLTVVQQQESALTAKVIETQKLKEEVLKDISIEQLVSIRNNTFQIVKQGVGKLLEVTNNEKTAS